MDNKIREGLYEDRFEIFDSRFDSRATLKTSQEAIEKATAIGSSRFGYTNKEGKTFVIEKNIDDGKWYQTERNPKQINNKRYTVPVEEIQKTIDERNLRSIIENAESRPKLKVVSKESDAVTAKEDVIAFRKIQDKELQKSAAVIMLENTEKYSAYGEEIKKSAKETYKIIVEIGTSQQATQEALNSEQKNISKSPSSGNVIESDEIFATPEPGKKSVLPPDFEKQYKRMGNKYYTENGSSLEDKGNRIETQSNEERVVSSMILIAEARGWNEIKVSGSESFKKEAWIEANSKGMHVKGYIPRGQDKEELRKRTGKMDHSKNMAETWATKDPQEAARIYPELASATALAVAIDKKAEADGLNPAQRAVVAARTKQNIINSIEKGKVPGVKIKEEAEISTNRKEKELVR